MRHSAKDFNGFSNLRFAFFRPFNGLLFFIDMIFKIKHEGVKKMNNNFWPWSRRHGDLLEATDPESFLSMNALKESYSSMNRGFDFYGKWLLKYLQEIGLQGRVLDVGCGNGFVAKKILENLPHVSNIVGVDINPIAIEMAVIHDGFQAILADMYQLNVAEVGTFDATIFVDVLHHLKPIDALQQVSSVLRPGGKVIIFDVARNAVGWLISKFLNTTSIIKSKDFEKSVLRGYTPAEVQSFLEEVGLQNINVKLVAGHFNAAVATTITTERVIKEGLHVSFFVL